MINSGSHSNRFVSWLQATYPAARPQPPVSNPMERYQGDPVGYVKQVLKQHLWSKQEEICRRMLAPPHKVLVKACHSVGKTWLSAALVNWFFDCFPEGACITTAPTHREVCDLLWREVRLLRAGRGGFAGASAPLLYAAPDRYAKGFTAKKGESFRGRHQKHMMFLFDEATGIEPVMWEEVRGMFKPDGCHFWLAFCNPTNTATQFYREELDGNWDHVSMSALDHPNLHAELKREPAPFPAAVSLQQWEMWLKDSDWTDRIDAKDAAAGDVEWPPKSGEWYRPGPEFEARALGRWPSQATNAVWSNAAWTAALCGDNLSGDFDLRELPMIGCDPARFGDDYSAFHWRWGGRSLGHERHNGWDGPRIVGRLHELCGELAALVNARLAQHARKVLPQEIRVNIDADGMGGMGAVDWGAGYRFVGVGASTSATDPSRYPNKRCELWFNLALRAKRGMLDLSRISTRHLRLLQQQFMSPIWWLDSSGKRMVEQKADTKDRLKSGSPDDADACNLAYYEGGFEAPEVVAVDAPNSMQPREDSNQKRRGMYGRR